jgi:hypothetical protein
MELPSLLPYPCRTVADKEPSLRGITVESNQPVFGLPSKAGSFTLDDVVKPR